MKIATINVASVLSFVAACSLTGAVVAQEFLPYAATAHPSQDGRCRGDPGKADLDRSEKAGLAQLTGIATRQSKSLRLKLYKNRPEGCDQRNNAYNCIEYKLTGYFAKHGLLLIEIGYYEGVEWMLVRLDGDQETKIVAPPHYSPHEKWLASAC